jgi:regulator of replication initiation timing
MATIAMHKTEAGEKRKDLKRTALELEKEVKALQNIQQMRAAARTRQDEADRLKAEAEALKDNARLEDLHVWEMEKEKRTKKGSKTYTYWMASWREGNKVRNVHLGSFRMLDAKAARQKAQKMKAKALGLHLSE